jgi:excisionase family DNA binding protein
MAREQSGRRRSGPPLEGSQDFLTTAEVARWLGISPRTICYWAASGTFPGIKVGANGVSSELQSADGWIRS